MNFLDRIHAPAAALLAMTCASGTAGIVAFFALVPTHTLEKLAGLPWSTIFTVGVPLLVSAITAIRSAFVGPVVAPKTPEPPAAP